MTEGYKHLFGPVPSRRLGMSLGVDLIPHKICSLNCVYCECGSSTLLTSERKEYVPLEEVYRELTGFFKVNPDPDHITFSGAGEPTLHSRLGEVIGFLKELRPAIPVAVLTNGTLLSDPGVRKELMKADLVLPSLDAATEKSFRRINRPLGRLTLESYVEGLVRFSREFEGQIWMEVLVLPGYNDDAENIDALKEALQKINPHRIQLNTLDRPGTVKGLKAASRPELERIARRWQMEGVEIIAPPQEREEVKAYRTDMESVILETLSRRPSTLEDLEKILGLPGHEISRVLSALVDADRVETNLQERGTFFQLRKNR